MENPYVVSKVSSNQDMINIIKAGLMQHEQVAGSTQNWLRFSFVGNLPLKALHNKKEI